MPAREQDGAPVRSAEQLAVLVEAVAAALRVSPVPVVLIDGPSGAGKSTLADALVAAWPSAVPPTLVRMDDLYPGWEGLAAGALAVHEKLLLPRSRGLPAGWQRHDWTTGAGGEWVGVAAARPLVVEGCGTLLAANVPLADVRVWLTADDAVRKRRALARDRGAFDAHWDGWQRQFDAFVANEHPLDAATVVLDGTGETAAPGPERPALAQSAAAPPGVAHPGGPTTVGP